jgi:hypothetical protein
MSDKTGTASQAAMDATELAAELNEVRRQLTGEVKLRQSIIKPLDRAQRALKDPHRNAVALHEATDTLSQPPEEVAVPKGYDKLVKRLRALADEKLSELEFTFARDLREAFAELSIKLAGPPTKLIADLFVIEPDLRKKQVQMTFSRQPITRGAIKLDVEKVVMAYQRARREICERDVDLDELLKDLFEAYGRTLKLNDDNMGARANIVECYRELVMVRQPMAFRRAPAKNSFIDYPKTHFIYDMLQVRQQRRMNFQNHRLNLGVSTIEVGADSTRAMFLATSPTEGQFIKDLYFTAEK